MLDWRFGSNIFTGFLDSLIAPVQDWLNQYPWLLWLTTHPWWLLVTVLLILFLLSGLLRAIAGLTEKLWLALLSLPVMLVRWIWQGTIFLLSRPFASKPAMMQSGLINPPNVHLQDRLTEVLDRLESLRQEQDELLKEVKVLLSTRARSEIIKKP